MKRLIIATALLIAHCITGTRTEAAAIGTWNIYTAYDKITDIKPAGNTVYVLSSGSLFSYNVNDQNINVYNKVNCLNDFGITHIKWNGNVNRLIIVYENYNIDLLDNNGKSINISDYYSKSTTFDKTVNNIRMDGIYAYISTNFGILKVNMRKAEISETYNLGVKVTGCRTSGNRIYALTDRGIMSATTTDNLIDKSNWHNDSEANGSLFDDDTDIQVTSAHGYNEYRIYDDNNKCWWASQKDGKLQSYTEENGEQTITRRDIVPEGPKNNYFEFMTCHDGRMYSCGSYQWDLHYDATIQTLENGEWKMFQSDGIKEITNRNFEDMMCLAVDPIDPRRVIGGCRNGVYEFYDGQFVRLHNSETTNGIISTAVSGNPEYELITATCFDRDGNLWCFNSCSYTEKPLLRLDRNGNWTAYGDRQLLTYRGRSAALVKNMIQDSNGRLWFGNNFYEGVALFSYDITNDIIYTFDNFINQDNTDIAPSSVTAVAEDKDGNIWTGTNVGLIMLTPEQAADPSSGFTQVKIPRNDGTDNADYLLSGLRISCIVVDGANRKWIGTDGNGAYMISSDNMEEVYHFTTENSYIISDKIQSMAINELTGEVFFGTDKGLCSYMSDAVEPNEDMNKDNVYAYPNPVTPEYKGLITVMGLSFNADVKILTSNGVVVAEGTSNGGMFTWDGNDKNGKRVASGVYMVATAKSDGSKGTVCKIAIIN